MQDDNDGEHIRVGEQFIFVPFLQKGMSNQKLQIIPVVRLAATLDRTLILPGLNDFLFSSDITIKGAKICQDELLCHVVPFSTVYNVLKFKKDLQHHLNVSSVDMSELPANWKEVWTIGEIIIPKKLKFQKDKEKALFSRLKTVSHARVIILNGLVASLPNLASKIPNKYLTPQEYEAKVMSSFHLNDFLGKRLEQLRSKLLFPECNHPVNFILALHIRAEPDVRRMCRDACFEAEEMISWAVDHFSAYRNKSVVLFLTGKSLKYDTVGHLEGLGWCASKVSDVVKKDDLLHIQQAAIDFEVGKIAWIFVGLKLSSFSTETFKIRSDLGKPSWEFVKGRVIPWRPQHYL